MFLILCFLLLHLAHMIFLWLLYVRSCWGVYMIQHLLENCCKLLLHTVSLTAAEVIHQHDAVWRQKFSGLWLLCCLTVQHVATSLLHLHVSVTAMYSLLIPAIDMIVASTDKLISSCTIGFTSTCVLFCTHCVVGLGCMNYVLLSVAAWGHSTSSYEAQTSVCADA